MNSESTALLTPGELRALIKHWRLAPQPAAPLAGLPEAPAASPPPVLAGSELWRHAITVLAAPEHCIRVVTPGPQATGVTHYYAQPSSGRMEFVGYWSEGDRVCISHPWTPETISEHSGRPVVPGPAAPPVGSFSAKLTPSGIIVLMAAVDALREITFTALLERNAALAVKLDRALLQRQLERGFACSDARWSVTMLRLMIGAGATPPAGLLDSRLHELVTAGLLQPNGNEYTPTDSLLELATDWMTALPAVFHEAAALPRGRQEIYRCCLAFRGAGPLWVIDYPQMPGSETVGTLRSMDAADYLKFLARMLAMPGAQPTVQARVADASVPCHACGKPRDPQANFCPECGAGRAPAAAKAAPQLALPAVASSQSTASKTAAPKVARAAPANARPATRSEMEALAQTLQSVRGVLGPEHFKSLHTAFQCQDPNGGLWTVGLETLQWHRKVSGQWTPDRPPERLLVDTNLRSAIEALASVVPRVKPATAPAAQTKPAKPQPATPAPPPMPQRSASPPPPPPPLPLPTANAEKLCPNPKCGKKVTGKKKFCPACGTPVA